MPPSISNPEAELSSKNLKSIIKEFLVEFEKLSKLDKEILEKIVNELISKHKTNFKGIGQPLRIALVGSKFGPGIYNIILSLSKDTVIKRLSKIN